MGSLSNLYISQSYQGLIHLATNTSASVNLIELQDGLGNNLGVSLNTEGDISASGDLTANTLRIELDTEITGGVDINTFFTASTPGYINSTNPYFTDVVRVIGSYTSAGGIPPTINDVKVGWICNGINVTNGIVTAVSGSGTGDVYVTIAGSLPQISQPYTFTGMVTIPTRITGSLQVSNDITASANLYVSGTINSNRVITTTISSSQIYSSGSNIFGDSISDSQTIVGGTTISGSLTIDGQLIHRGNVDITGSLKVSNDISSSTVSGIGNVTAYSASVQSFINNVSSSISGTINTLSQSVDSRLDYLEGPFSTSVDQRLDSLEFFSSSQETKDITLGAYTASLITAFTASGANVAFNGNISVSGSINAYQLNVLVESSSVIFSSGSNVLGDASNDTQTLNGTVNVVNTLFISGTEFRPFSQSVDNRLDSIESFTGSYATTGSNTFIGNQIFSGSVRGGVNALTITSQTASMDCSLGNFFTLTLPTSSTILINPSNILPGETLSLKIQQPSAGTGSAVILASSIKFPSLNTPYSVSSATSSIDILTFISFDSSSLFGSAVKNFI